MWTEPMMHSPGTGWVEVIAGGMFSGKTEELLRRLRRAQIAGQNTLLFKPAMDTRFATADVVSHDQRSIPCEPVASAQPILLLAAQAQVVGIDEAQFFDPELVDVVNELANRGKRVVLAGLDMDYTGRPFGPMPHLMAVAEFVTKLHAICVRTGQLAHYSHRRAAPGKPDGQVRLGAGQEYEPLSRKAFLEELKKKSGEL